MNNITPAFLTASILGLLFILLKLTGHLAWSWLWVLAPFWLPLTLGVTLIAIYFAVLALIFLVSVFLKK